MAAALTATLGPVAVRAQCSESDRKALEAFDRAWSDATNRGDRAFLQTAYADDYLGLGIATQQGKVRAIEDAVRLAETNRANPSAVPKVTYSHYVIHCTPVTATITHRNEITTIIGGKEQTSYSRSLHNLEKRSGRWQVVSNTGHSLSDAMLLQYMELDWNEAFLRRDRRWFERNYADDVSSIGNASATIQNKQAAIATALADTTLQSLELSDLNIRVDGNAAIVTGINRIRGRDSQGKPYNVQIAFTDTFVKRDGRWLVWATQGTRVP